MYKDNSKRANKAVRRMLENNLKLVGELIATQTRSNISGYGQKGSLKAVKEGQHLSSVYWELVKERLAVVIGFDGTAKHSIFVELGTKRMKARPSLQVALNSSKKAIRRLLTKGFE